MTPRTSCSAPSGLVSFCPFQQEAMQSPRLSRKGADPYSSWESEWSAVRGHAFSSQHLPERLLSARHALARGRARAAGRGPGASPRGYEGRRRGCLGRGAEHAFPAPPDDVPSPRLPGPGDVTAARTRQALPAASLAVKGERFVASAQAGRRERPAAPAPPSLRCYVAAPAMS